MRNPNALEVYQQMALRFVLSLDDMDIDPVAYLALAMSGEAGEVCGKVKRIYRDHESKFTPETGHDIAHELGDVLWYIAVLADKLGYSLDEIAAMNIEKLENRAAKGTLHGEGDNR